VAFSSDASNLVPGDTNGKPDVFVHDRQTGRTTRVSVASDNVQANSGSCSPSISADGRYVAFESSADNLVPGDTNGTLDVFVNDRLTGRTTWVSGNAESNANRRNISISADGRFVAFRSDASGLVPGDTNGKSDIFVHEGTGLPAKDVRLRFPISGNGKTLDIEKRSASVVRGGGHDRLAVLGHGGADPLAGKGMTPGIKKQLVSAGRGTGGGSGGKLSPEGFKTDTGMDAEISGSIDDPSRSPEAIAAAIRLYQSGIKYAYTKELPKNPNIRGQITVEFVIRPDGSVESVDIKQSTIDWPPLEEAIRKRISLRWNFGPSKGGPVKVTYPFVFAPEK
jgi:TonB family protein